MFGLFKKKSVVDKSGQSLFRFVPDNISQKVVRSLVVKTDLYSKTKRDLIILGQEHRRIYQFEPTTLDVILVPDTSTVKVMCGDKQIGTVPGRQTEHALYAIKGDYVATAELSGGPYKIIQDRFDDYGHPNYWIDKHDDDIEVKVFVRY